MVLDCTFWVLFFCSCPRSSSIQYDDIMNFLKQSEVSYIMIVAKINCLSPDSCMAQQWIALFHSPGMGWNSD